jgi:hypothetical protein
MDLKEAFSNLKDHGGLNPYTDDLSFNLMRVHLYEWKVDLSNGFRSSFLS